MAVDFRRDLRLIFTDVLSRNADKDSKAAIRKMTEGKLVLCYLNWRRRMIKPQPRILIGSAEFAVSKRQPAYIKQVSALLSKIETGVDISCHLSSRVLCPYVHRGNPKPMTPKNRPDLDLLLNDWGIHHLHISDEMDPKGTGFVKRGDLLLFAIFIPDRVYLLDILTHEDFASDRIFQIINANWPNDRLIISLNVLPGRPDSTGDRKRLREAGYITSIIIDNKLYISGITCMSSAGTSMRDSQEADQFLRRIAEVEATCRNAAFVRGIYDCAGLTCPADPELRLASLLQGWGVVDAPTNHVVYHIQ
jgi:hypothetical protein